MIHLIKDSKGKTIGWKLNPITKEEQELAGAIRDLQFFGCDDTKIVYDGLKLLDESKGKQLYNIESLTWIQRKHQKD